MKLIKELQRRNVFKATIAYLVTSWLILQVTAILFPILEVDPMFQRWVLIALAIGFPAWIVFAYIYEWTPEGFRQTADLEDTDPTAPTVQHSNTYIILGLSLAVVLLVADRVFHLTNAGPAKVRLSTIAVLPFSHESAEGEDEFFTSGVHEDIMIKLAGVKDFRIVSKSSVMKYKDFEGDIRELGETLDAEYILQGAVRRWQDQIRLTVQLTESASDQLIWSHEYDSPLKNIFELQAEIATEISSKLEADLSPDEKSDIALPPTTVLSAYDDFLKAREILNRPRTNYDEVKQAISLLEMAVRADEKFTKAWALLVQAQSELYSLLAKMEGREDEKEVAKTAAMDALKKAKELAPDGWEVLSEEGFFHFNIEKDNIAALSSFEKALQQNPSDVNSMGKLATVYVTMGALDKAVDVLERGFALEHSNGFITYSLTFAYEMTGQYEKMIPFLERLYQLYPDTRHYLVEARYYQFLHDGSIESFKAFQESVKTSNASNPWDERAIKNMDMIVAMFNGDFESYHEDWKGRHESHIQNHGNWMCPLVANDHINHAHLLLKNDKTEDGQEILKEVNNIVLRPVNPNSVCIFDPNVYMPKLDYLAGREAEAKEKLEALILPTLKNESFPLGAVERSVLLEAIDMILPGKVFYYYEQIVKETISLTSFESICADPWTFPNLIRDPKFMAEVRQDGRFVEFLEMHGFLGEG